VPAISRSLRAVTYGNGWFVAVGSSSAVFTSQNGATWTYRTNAATSATISSLYTAAYGDTSFFAAGSWGQILESLPFNAPTPSFSLELKRNLPGFLWMTGPEAHGYQIDSTDSLSNAWTPVTVITNLSATTILPVGSSNGARFYRGKVVN
jgi:hypothetical protein